MTSGHCSKAFCSACIASQIESPWPDGNLEPAQGVSVQCGAPAAGPLYPVESTCPLALTNTQPTALLPQVDRLAITSATVNHVSFTCGLISQVLLVDGLSESLTH